MAAELLKIVKRVHELFSRYNETLSVAESCTGGLISHLITTRAGASVFFRTGIIAYSREAKEELLGVSGKTIDAFGMVSKETAIEMAENTRLSTGTDYSVASTGNLGPDVLEGKQKGLIYLAVCRDGKTVTKRLNLKGNRGENKKAAAQAALELLAELLEKEG